GSKEIMAPIAVPLLKTEKTIQSPPALCVLISSAKDVYLCQESGPDIFFQLPNCFENQGAGLVALFLNNKKLMPWFPAVLIGENYRAALEFLQQVNPKRIVTNNTGIAYEAYKRGIPWIAGPYLNLANSFGLLCLKERFACYGAFISNELNNYQIKTIVSPENFKRYYRIYHPILLMTSRQCLFHQVTGCEKNAIDGDCIQTCHKSSSITNLKNLPLFIEKTQGNYHCIYNHINFLNTDIVTDLPGFFTGFFIDLRQIKTQTRSGTDKPGIMALFERLLKGDPDSKKEITQMIHPSTNLQYQKGI
ncbi:MAG: U32 family peptidase, partial [Proteobacteria bacterium]|nr:U32 family peptidase [Pseudomonadota bacterium]